MSREAAVLQEGLVSKILPPKKGPLIERFGWAPYSVMNTRDGAWQAHKRRWLNWMGIKSEEGRAEALTFNIPLYLPDGSTGARIRVQTSVFDPTLCELCYRWWCPAGGVVVDPFAGGSVRGIVAAVAGHKYYGCELRAEQVAANRQQWADGPYVAIGVPHAPKWRAGDAFNEMDRVPPHDFLFSCPPYGNLEKYSELPQDLSTMSYGTFLDRYGDIIAKAASRLKPDRFAAWVVANYRDKETGKYRDFVGDTVRCFEAAGCEYYNEIVLVNAVGTAAMRANNTFIRGHRKVVKSHQNVLVFVKGDPRAAAANLPVPIGMEGAGKDNGEGVSDELEG